MSFIFKYKISRVFLKGVSGGCFILIKNDITHNPALTLLFIFVLFTIHNSNKNCKNIDGVLGI